MKLKIVYNGLRNYQDKVYCCEVVIYHMESWTECYAKINVQQLFKP